MLVSCTTDGLLSLWSGSGGRLNEQDMYIAGGEREQARGAEATSLATCSVTGLAAVGSADGRLRLIDVDNPKTPQVSACSRRSRCSNTVLPGCISAECARGCTPVLLTTWRARSAGRLPGQGARRRRDCAGV